MKSKNEDERVERRKLLKTMVERTSGASTVPCSGLLVLLLSCCPGGNGSCSAAQKCSWCLARSCLLPCYFSFASALGTDDNATFTLPQGATHH